MTGNELQPEPSNPPQRGQWVAFVPLGAIFLAAAFVFAFSDVTRALAWTMAPLGLLFLIIGFFGISGRPGRDDREYDPPRDVNGWAPLNANVVFLAVGLIVVSAAIIVFVSDASAFLAWSGVVVGLVFFTLGLIGLAARRRR